MPAPRNELRGKARRSEISRGGQDDVDRLGDLVRLSLALPLDAAARDWNALLEQAERERVLALIWMRGLEELRARCDAAVLERWRRRALTIAAVGQRQLEALGEAVHALRQRDARPIVLKGAPLSQMLYGDAVVRPATDIDILVPADRRAAASEALHAAGWQRTFGEAPDEETFERRARGLRIMLELHSTPLDDPLMQPIRIPVDSMELSIGGEDIPTQWGESLPAFLAAHMAKHQAIPLLWVIDFRTLWRSLDEIARARAADVARRIGLARHLSWALRLIRELERIGDPHGGLAAAAALARLIAPIDDVRRVWRLMSLSASPVAAARVASARIWPETSHARPGDVLASAGSRLAGWLYRRLLAEGTHPPISPTDRRALSLLLASESAEVERALAAGHTTWVRVESGRMSPAIPLHSHVLLAPSGPGAPRIGDVVLARTSPGEVALHRVVAAQERELHLRGDARGRRELVVDRGNVLGVCETVDVGGRPWRIADRPVGVLAMLRAIARKRFGVAG